MSLATLRVGERTSRFVYYVVEDWPVRLVGMDTLIPGNPGGALCAERLVWLDSTLAAAPDRPSVVFMHHPPFRTGIQAMDAMGLGDAAALAQVVAPHPQIERIVCGHVHQARR